MSITISGDGSITGLVSGGLPDGSVTAADLASGAITTGALPSGSVLQVVHATYATQVTQGGPTWKGTGLTASITPSSTSSKILIIVNQPLQQQANTTATREYRWQLLRDGATVVDEQIQDETEEANTAYYVHPLSIGHCNVVDTPSTTSSITYNTRIWIDVGTADIFAQTDGCPSRITLMEIAG